MSTHCGSCKHSHLMQCTNDGCINYGKRALHISYDISDCFVERRLKRKEYMRFRAEIECLYGEPLETREYYDMTGDDDYVYRIGILKEVEHDEYY